MSALKGKFLPYGRQVIEDDDIAEVVRVLKTDMLTTGPEVPRFEDAFAAATGARHAVACANGTAALHLAYAAAGIGPGTTVIVPSITFLATANAARLCGSEVSFADVDPHTGLMTLEAAKSAIQRASNPVAAIVPVHLGGQTACLEALQDLARASGAALIEDACHALGTTYETSGGIRSAGGCSETLAATFSLHPVKTIAAGEGGVVTTNVDSIAAHMRRNRSHGMTREPSQLRASEMALAPDGAVNPWYYEMPEVGLNYRLTDFQAALARNQLAKLPRFAKVRQRIAALYDALLPKLAPLVMPVPRVSGCKPVLHLYQVLIDFEGAGISRRQLIECLKQRGIGTQVHYIPVHRQPYYADRYPGLSLPGADAFYSRTLSLPLFAGMSEADAERVVEALAWGIAVCPKSSSL